VHRRLAEHKNRKGNPAESAQPAQPVTPGNSRAAEAAARVAARYSQAKSYTQMQAEEARMAVRAAEIATQVAMEAQSAAHSALAELHAASVEQPPAEVVSINTAAHQQEIAPEPPAVQPAAPEWDWAADRVAASLAEPAHTEPVRTKRASAKPAITAAMVERRITPEITPVAAPVPEPPAGPVTNAKDSAGQVVHIRWDADMPVRSARPAPEPFELASEDWWTPAEQAIRHDEPVEIEAHPIHANLISFPREIVATRRMRPRLADVAIPEPGTQLSIFEVDPDSVETEAPAPEVLFTEEAGELHSTEREAEPANAVPWATAEWVGAGMKLDAPAEPVARAVHTEAANRPELAPLERRLMAGVIDGAVVLAVAGFFWLSLALGMQHTMAIRAAEVLGASVLVIAGMAYHAFFSLLSLPTLGMRYAGLSLCTFDECIPTPEQHRRRLAAMVLSMAPVGLGMVWSVFDEDHLSWHDRYSQTYLRMS
jgi:uncharacterized RDD family membrane protein YckC